MNEYEKVNWEDGTVVTPARVTIDGVDYDVTPAVESGTTPVSASNLAKMDNGIYDLSQNKIDKSTIELITVSDTAPSNCAIGDLYYNTTDEVIYEGIDTDTWSQEGELPSSKYLYVDLTNSKLYYYDGSSFSPYGGGGASLSNIYGTSDENGYTQEYINGELENKIDKAVVKLLTVTNNMPRSWEVGDMYYSTSTNLIYTAIHRDYFDDGQPPSTKCLYVTLDTSKIYYYDGANFSLYGEETDTGWVDLQIYTNNFVNNVSAMPVRYRKIGNLVRIEGIVNNVNELSAIASLSTLPSSIVASGGYYYMQTFNNFTQLFTIHFYSSQIYLGPVPGETLPANSLLPFNITYFVD